jgi:hypothetical protein
VIHHHFRRYDILQLQALWRHLPVQCLLLSYFNTRLYPLIRIMRGLGKWLPSRELSTDLAMPSSVVNCWLHRIFAGESCRLLKLLDGRSTMPYRRGVSIIAILKRL